jgi:hypothetical protein
MKGVAMRVGAVVALVLLLLALAADAPAGDEPPKAPKKDLGRPVSETEWIARVLDIDKVDAVGVKRKDLLAFAAKRSVVLVTVKIWDIRTTPLGAEIDIVDVMPQPEAITKNRLPRNPILLPPEERAAISEWGRWDRLTFKVKPSVTADGALDYERLVAGAKDLNRVPNPGVEYPPLTKDLAPLDSFGDWLTRFAGCCGIPDWRMAWQAYSLASSRVFPMSATAREGAVDANGRGPRVPVNVVFDIAKATGLGGYGLLDGSGRPITTVRALVEDPQVAESLTAGAKAVIHLRVHGFQDKAEMERQRGRFRVEVSFGRLR